MIAWAALWSGDSPDLTAARLFDILDTPVNAVIWILVHVFRFKQQSTMGWWFLLHFGYWTVLGGLAGWVVGVVRLKLFGDDE